MAIFDFVEKKLDYKYYATDPYYPKRYYNDSDLSEAEVEFRRIVWEFKDGLNYDFIAEALSEGIDEITEIANIDEWTLCCIPASTALKTQIKFKNFCDEFCRITNINNGFGYISNREDLKAQNLEWNSINLVAELNFSKKLNGRKVLLFDDIIARGETFLQIAEHLKRIGVTEVVGMMIGKTTYKRT